MSETMSGPNDWLNFYEQNFPAPPPEAATASSTAVTATSPPLGMFNSSTTTATRHLSPEGRVSKPVRRRSRASRRTPTTLLNTDTANFRAMVQQFTGGPSGPFAPTASVAAADLQNLGFGLGSRDLSPARLMVSAPSGFQLRQQQQLYQQQQQQLQNQHIFGINSSNSNREGGENMFFQRLSNDPRPDHGRFLMDGRFFPNAPS
ncbi:hypothetical protein L6164_028893 [Bauhinia variegata]|nr:hypothetical protein L6164_028893 [Bauhinia variegata]